jgi:hypothetical protein
MSNVYVLVEERENSVACRIHGVWNSRENACQEMMKMVKSNELFTERSIVNIEEGSAESDPDYCEEEYCNYSVDEYQIK